MQDSEARVSPRKLKSQGPEWLVDVSKAWALRSPAAAQSDRPCHREEVGLSKGLDLGLRVLGVQGFHTCRGMMAADRSGSRGFGVEADHESAPQPLVSVDSKGIAFPALGHIWAL